ncbi:hypothetical protein F5Y19DRAFT_457633 [Xylariaceae sp. FL1651]|nr:hypothetical protein F5Y19DRAFT_457633 [Xylariaceae sp. FL1651]
MAAEYDIIIIGGGPGGLSAASSIVRQDHKTLLLDSGKYRNMKSKMHTLASWDHRDPEEFRAAARADFDRYGSVTVDYAEVDTVKQQEEHFEVSANDKTWTAKKIILATGVEDVFPDIQGYADCWITGIFHCLYCHGWEERGISTAGMLAEGDTGAVVPALHVARQALRMADRVTLYTNGNKKLADELEAALEVAPAPMVVNGQKITKLVKAPKRSQVTVELEDGTSITEGFIAHKPKTKLRGDLAQQLGLEITPMNTIKVLPPFNQTSVKGVFAAGDCSSPMMTLTQALATGTCVGGGAPLQIQAEMYHQKAIF